MTVCFAFNYGSRSELVNSVNKSIKNLQKIKKVTEEMISKNLYTAKIPDPDILIRTGGYQRLSNFLLWQLSYSEIFFLKKSWPDFNYVDLKKIVNKFSSIKRNFGSIDE
jgi:undecaprenyl diphosphate synthase